jgi:hypothetical protein
LPLLLTVGSGCGGSKGASGGDDDGIGDTNGPGDSQSEGGDTTPPGTDTSDPGTDDDTIFDVGSGDVPGDGEEGCEGIDFLFVIDKSSSMAEKQQNLVDSFPGFVSAIEAKVAELEAADFNILVTHTDTIGIYNIDQYCMWECPTDEGVCELDGSACSFVNDYSCLDARLVPGRPRTRTVRGAASRAVRPTSKTDRPTSKTPSRASPRLASRAGTSARQTPWSTRSRRSSTSPVVATKDSSARTRSSWSP